jgi:type IV pilus assembly protein PilW
MNSQKGLSLIELMISITLGLMLMLGVLNVFLGSKGAFVSQQAISRIQESGRFAIDYMNKEIRMAGFVGCASKVDASQITNHLVLDADNFRWNYNTIIKGYTDTDAADIGLSDLVSGTDVLEVVSASGSQALVTAATTATSIPVAVAEEASGCGATARYGGLCVNDILVVSNCQRAEIFKAGVLSTTAVEVAGTGTAAGDNETDLTGATFNEGAEVIKMRKLLFYIENNTAGVPSLWVWENGTSTELVEGVEDMAIQYGIDADNNDVPDEYKEAGEVADDLEWSNVKSVHLELLVRTPEDRVLTEAQVYSFPLDAASKTTAADGAMRQVFVTTVAVRSRLN